MGQQRLKLTYSRMLHFLWSKSTTIMPYRIRIVLHLQYTVFKSSSYTWRKVILDFAPSLLCFEMFSTKRQKYFWEKLLGDLHC
jgi:hypothetical protein